MRGEGEGRVACGLEGTSRARFRFASVSFNSCCRAMACCDEPDSSIVSGSGAAGALAAGAPPLVAARRLSSFCLVSASSFAKRSRSTSASEP